MMGRRAFRGRTSAWRKLPVGVPLGLIDRHALDLVRCHGSLDRFVNCLDIHARRNVEHKFLFFSGRSVTRAIVNGPMVEASTANDLEFTGSRADGFDNWAMEVEVPSNPSTTRRRYLCFAPRTFMTCVSFPSSATWNISMVMSLSPSFEIRHRENEILHDYLAGLVLSAFCTLSRILDGRGAHVKPKKASSAPKRRRATRQSAALTRPPSPSSIAYATLGKLFPVLPKESPVLSWRRDIEFPSSVPQSLCPWVPPFREPSAGAYWP